MREFRKYITGIDPQDEETTWDSVIPAKAVSRLIRQKSNLDSRVRGRDQSREEPQSGKSPMFIFRRPA
jgi:hypothetical protein